MSTRDDDILDFDFFDEEDAPSWDEPEGFDPQAAGAERGRRGRGSRLPPATEPHAAPPSHRPDRARDPRRRPARGLGRGVRRGREARPQPDVPRRHRRDRERLGEARAAAGDDADDARPQAGGSGREARRLRPDRREPDAAGRGPRRTRTDGRAEQRRCRGLALPGERLRGLQAAFKETADETDASVAGEQLLAQTRRLLASDIIWTDSFQEPAEVVLQEKGSKGSTFRRRSSSRPTISSARARSPRSGSGSRARRRVARRQGSTAAASPT